MLASELKVLLAGASPETLRLVRAARERDLTILREYLDAGVSRVPETDALHRMQTEIWQTCAAAQKERANAPTRHDYF